MVKARRTAIMAAGHLLAFCMLAFLPAARSETYKEIMARLSKEADANQKIIDEEKKAAKKARKEARKAGFNIPEPDESGGMFGGFMGMDLGGSSGAMAAHLLKKQHGKVALEVKGAGSDQHNGQYAHFGEDDYVNGRPKYYKMEYPELGAGKKAMPITTIIYDDKQNPPRWNMDDAYESISTAAKPPASGWTIVGGEHPPPTLVHVADADEEEEDDGEEEAGTHTEL